MGFWSLLPAIEYHQKECPPEMNFALVSKGSNQFLGMAWFYPINWYIPSFEIHYWLDTRLTGNGYMTEAINALSKTCFTLYGAKRVQVSMSVNNKKSRIIVEKLGFSLEGETIISLAGILQLQPTPWG